MADQLKIEIKDVDLGMNAIMDAMKDMISMEAVTGYFQDDIEDGIGLAQLMATHEFGSDERNIPERPAMRLSFDNNIDDIKDFMFKIGDKAIFEQTIPAEDAYQVIGDFYKVKFQNGVITKELGLEDNAPRTIEKKGSDTPLIDSKRLVNGINTKVEEK